jgi:phenylalanyl-tRNA synthetase beta chain
VKRDVSYGAIEKICLQNSSDILKDVQFIEQYVGDKIAADQKALVFSLVYQSKTRTLREEEVMTTHQRIVEALITQLGATRR